MEIVDFVDDSIVSLANAVVFRSGYPSASLNGFIASSDEPHHQRTLVCAAREAPLPRGD
jgi:hypothetical protein